MNATAKSLFDLTAAELMSEVVLVLREWMPLREAAEELARGGVHGAPVVDAGGRCVGVLSVSDLARWAVHTDSPPPARPRTCSHQEPYRAVGGEETTLCTLPAGTCSLQTTKHLAGGRAVQACREPSSVCLEWQMVEMEMLPAEDVRHYMTTEPVTVEPGTLIREMARRMLDAGVRRVIVTDSAGGPVGVVSVTDLVAAVAGADDGVAPPDGAP
jgi:CBS domain-containing protein